MIQTILVYSLLALLMFYFSREASKGESWYHSIYFFIPILLFSLIFGMRYGVGIDYNSYLFLYKGWNGFENITKQYIQLEPGYLFILELCRKLSLNAIGYFSVLSFLQIFFLFMAFKNYKKVLPYISVTLIFSGIAILNFSNGIRQNIAFCIFIFAIKYINERKLFKYILYITLACLFHKSAIILYPLYLFGSGAKGFFNNIKLQYLLLFICFCTVFFNPIPIILSYLEYWITLAGYKGYLTRINYLEGDRTIGIMDIINLLIYMIIISHNKKMKEFFHCNFFNTIYDLFFIGILLNYIFWGSLLFGRLILYFTNISFIILGYIWLYFSENKCFSLNNYLRYTFVSLFVLLSFTRVVMYADKNTAQYVFYFQKDLHAMKDKQREDLIKTLK